MKHEKVTEEFISFLENDGNLKKISREKSGSC